MKIKYLIHFLLITVFFAIGFNSIEVRLSSMISFDDSPVTYSYIYKNNEYYQGDPVRETAKVSSYASLQNSLGIFLNSVFKIPESVYFIAIVYLQYLLSILAIFVFSKHFFHRAVYGYAGILFFHFIPYSDINLANYGSLLWTPYAATMAIPLQALAFILCEKGKRQFAFVLFFIAGFWHPTVAIYSLSFILGLNILKKEKIVKNILSLKWALLSVPLFVLPGLLLGRTNSTAPIKNWIEGLLQNQHLFPWQEFYLWSYQNKLVQVIIVTTLAFKLTNRNRIYFKLLATSSILAIFWVGVQFFGIFFKSPNLILLAGGRFISLHAFLCLVPFLRYLSIVIVRRKIQLSIFWLIFLFWSLKVHAVTPLAFPTVYLLIKHFIQKIFSRTNWVQNLSEYLQAGLPLIINIGCMVSILNSATLELQIKRLIYLTIGSLFLLYILEMKQSKKVVSKVFIGLLPLTYLFYYLPYTTLVETYIGPTPFYLQSKEYIPTFIIFLFSVAILFLVTQPKRTKIWKPALAILSLSLILSWHFEERRKSKVYSNSELQLWIKENTLSTDRFVIGAFPWRSLSQRMGIIPINISHYMVYGADINMFNLAKTYSEQLDLGYCVEGQCKFPRYQVQMEDIKKVPFKKLIDFSKIHGAQYLVLDFIPPESEQSDIFKKVDNYYIFKI